ncbi:hypothetical protein EVG20_g6064 [Dentipellis fragilis]|uniref:Uncharacterized protein n=1 Tax=Dentipellis fragilis TaxID=205917 RepID=A0A4Y9YPK6_9AGAM|nr:hypothetical protein EVG20_g6064 [Dentipellis fragilis]
MRITSSVNVIEHAIVPNDSSEWPAALVDLAGVLLPPAHPGEPDKASGLNSSEVSEALSDVRLLATNLQKMVRLERESRGVPPNPKTIFLVRIIRAIFYFTMTDCVIWEFAEIVRPMHPLAHANSQVQWLPKTAEAAFLLLHPIFNYPSPHDASFNDHSSAASTDSQSSTGSREGSANSSESTSEGGAVSGKISHPSSDSVEPHLHGGSRAEEQMDEVDEVDVVDNSDEIDEVDDPESLSPESDPSASADGLDPIASQIHILSDPTRRPMPLLGLLCMADVDNIFDIMASMLHQRRAWGIATQPVVGLAFDRDQTSVQVVFGWFDNSDVSRSYCMPLPHVAYAAPECTAKEKGGVFDLADPLSAEALATFLLSLRKRIESIRAKGDVRAEDVFAQVTSGTTSLWRADGPVPRMDADAMKFLTADEDEVEHAEGMWRETVQLWAKGVDATGGDSGQSDRIRDTKSSDQSVVDGVEAKARRSGPMSRASSEGRSGVNSTLAGAPYEIITYYIHPIEMWMLDRNTVCHSFSPLGTLDEFREEVAGSWLCSAEHHLQLYEDMTALYLPSAWISHPPTQGLNAQQVELMQAFLTGPVARRRQDDIDAGRIDRIQEPDSWLEACLSECLATSFMSLAHSERIKGMQTDQSVDEIAWWKGWDMIPMNVYAYLAKALNDGQRQVTAWDTLERTLRLPCVDQSIIYPEGRLGMMEMLSVYDRMDVVKKELDTESKLATRSAVKAEMEYKQEVTPSRERALAYAENWFNVATQAAMDIRRSISNWSQRRESLHLSEVESMDPKTAKCDSVAVVRIEGFFEGFHPEWAKSFALAPRTKPPSTKDLAISTNRQVDAPPRLVEEEQSNTTSTFGTFVDRHGTPPTVHSDIKYSTASDIEPTPPGSSSSDVSDYVNKLKDTRGAGSRGKAETDDADADDEDEVVLDKQDTLEIPIFIREYETLISAPRDSAENQGRLDLVAVVKFLGVLGITDFPIFGLVIEGTMGAVTCAWGEPDQDSKEIHIRIIDRNTRGFDLATVEGIINYTSFVAKLHREHAPRLASLFEERQIRAQVFQDYTNGDARLQWNMTQKFDTKRKGQQKA